VLAHADGIEGDYTSGDGERTEGQDIWDGDYISKEGYRTGNSNITEEQNDSDKGTVRDKMGGVLSSEEEREVLPQEGGEKNVDE